MLRHCREAKSRIEIDALSAHLGLSRVIPLRSTRGRGIEALKLAINGYKANKKMWNAYMSQPGCSTKQIHWQKVVPQHALNNVTGWACKCWKAISTAAPTPVKRWRRTRYPPFAPLRNEMDDPALTCHARYQCIAAICHVVSDTPDGRTQPFHHCGR